MVASIASLIVVIVVSAVPAATTCGHRLDGAPLRERVAWVEINCETLPCPCAGPGDTGEEQARQTPQPRRRAQRIRARITEVVDGDTVKVRAYDARRPRYTVRLLGIDTPETVRPGTPVECGGREAKGNLLDLAFTRPQDVRRQLFGKAARRGASTAPERLPLSRGSISVHKRATLAGRGPSESFTDASGRPRELACPGKSLYAASLALRRRSTR
jgi:hypothetical protein